MSNQTAVDFYEKIINSLIERYEEKEISKREFITMKHDLFYIAKETEKQQIIEAFEDGNEQGFICKEGIEYYNENYKNQ